MKKLILSLIPLALIGACVTLPNDDPYTICDDSVSLCPSSSDIIICEENDTRAECSENIASNIVVM